MSTRPNNHQHPCLTERSASFHESNFDVRQFAEYAPYLSISFVVGVRSVFFCKPSKLCLNLFTSHAGVVSSFVPVFSARYFELSPTDLARIDAVFLSHCGSGRRRSATAAPILARTNIDTQSLTTPGESADIVADHGRGCRPTSGRPGAEGGAAGPGSVRHTAKKEGCVDWLFPPAATLWEFDTRPPGQRD